MEIDFAFDFPSDKPHNVGAVSPEGNPADPKETQKLRSAVGQAVISILQHDVNVDFRAQLAKEDNVPKDKVPTVRIYPCAEEVQFEFSTVNRRTSQPERRVLKRTATQLELGDYSNLSNEYFAKLTLTTTIVVNLDLLNSVVTFHSPGLREPISRSAESGDLQQFLKILKPMKDSRGIEI